MRKKTLFTFFLAMKITENIALYNYIQKHKRTNLILFSSRARNTFSISPLSIFLEIQTFIIYICIDREWLFGSVTNKFYYNILS